MAGGQGKSGRVGLGGVSGGGRAALSPLVVKKFGTLRASETDGAGVVITPLIPPSRGTGEGRRRKLEDLPH